jgi:hypothetical protein
VLAIEIPTLLAADRVFGRPIGGGHVGRNALDQAQTN